MDLKKIVDRLLQPSSLAGISVLALLAAVFVTFGADPNTVEAVQAGVEAGGKALQENPDGGIAGYIMAAVAAISAFFAVFRSDKSDES